MSRTDRIDPALVERFLPRLPQGGVAVTAVDTATRARLTRQLEHVVARARARWALIDLDHDAFLAFLAERVCGSSGAGHAGAERALARLKTSDLYLARALLGGLPPALEALETQLLPGAHALILRAGAGAVRADQVMQLVCQRLLYPQGQRPARLSRYRGTVHLDRWLGVLALRTALELDREELGWSACLPPWARTRLSRGRRPGGAETDHGPGL